MNYCHFTYLIVTSTRQKSYFPPTHEDECAYMRFDDIEVMNLSKKKSTYIEIRLCVCVCVC